MAEEDSNSYDPAILHQPVDYDPNGPIAKVIGLLHKTLKATLKDKRVVEGIFTAFDKFGNMVLTSCKEQFEGQPQRKLPMVILPLDYLEHIELVLNPDPPAEDEANAE